MTKRPKTGEPRHTRQPLKIDRLPGEMHDAIQELRAEGWSWKRIEDESPKLKQWEKVPAGVKKLFPGQRLPHANLQRWYDLRVQQVQQEIREQGEKARVLAEAFTKRGMKDLPEAIQNALGDLTFSMANAGDEKSIRAMQKALESLGWLLEGKRKNDIQQAKLELERQKLEAKQNGGSELDPREIYLDAAQDLLKKLRTRKNVREVIDPIREELIAELAHGAEAFAKQIEARPA